MGQPRFLPRGLITLLVFFAACGGDDDLLVAADLGDVYAGGGGGKGYAATSTSPADFGTITGKVTYEGRRRRNRLSLSKEYCINANPNGMLSENFLVGPNGELGNVIVFVKRGLNNVSYPVPAGPVLLDQKGCRYIPHLVVVQHGQTLTIRNSDNHEHNVHWMPGVNEEFNKPMNSPGDLDPMTFSKTEIAASVKCEIHSWMQSYVALLPHPCWAITKEDGTFTIENVPPGSLVLAAWHEELGELEFEITTTKNGALAHSVVFPSK